MGIKLKKEIPFADNADLDATIRQQWAHDILIALIDDGLLMSEYHCDENEDKLINQAVRITDKLINKLSSKGE